MKEVNIGKRVGKGERGNTTPGALTSIIVGARFRKDFGDLEALAASIRDLGLLSRAGCAAPLAGERRLRACQRLGWDAISVFIRRSPMLDPELLAALPFALRAEVEGNVTRKDFSQSELAEIQSVILDHWTAVRKQRQGARTDLTSTQVAVEVGKPKRVENTHEQVAKLFGESEHTTRKRLAIVDAARAEPERFSKLVADMNRTGRIAGVYRRLSIIQQGERMRAAPPPLPTGPFDVGVADPPWPFEIRMLGPSRRAVCPYPTINAGPLSTNSSARPSSSLPTPSASSTGIILYVDGGGITSSLEARVSCLKAPAEAPREVAEAPREVAEPPREVAEPVANGTAHRLWPVVRGSRAYGLGGGEMREAVQLGGLHAAQRRSGSQVLRAIVMLPVHRSRGLDLARSDHRCPGGRLVVVDVSVEAEIVEDRPKSFFRPPRPDLRSERGDSLEGPARIETGRRR